jgi:imidazolonepropionase-like amidohydrolase
MEQFRHILAGRLVDGTGGPIRQGVLMTVAQGTLVSLAETRPDDFPGGGVVDMTSFTVLPGLVDAHVHLAMSGTGAGPEREAQRNASFEQAAVRIQGHLREHIRHGVVAVRDGGDGSGHALLYKKRFLQETPPPTVVKAAGRGWHAAGRYGSLIGGSPKPGEALAQAMARTWGGNDHVKIVNSGLNSLTRFGEETAPQFSLEELEKAVETAHALGKKVMIHANGRAPVRLALEAGCDSIEHGFFMGRENLERMAERKTVWVPTACTMAAYGEKLERGSKESEVAKRNLDHQLGQIGLASRVGVPVAVGTDSGSLGVHHGKSLAREIHLLMAAGFTLEEAVKSATAGGAALLGVEDHTGVLAPGNPATFVAVRGLPGSLVEALEAPELVVVRGQVVDEGKNSFSQRPGDQRAGRIDHS